jgi:hypothetical protein
MSEFEQRLITLEGDDGQPYQCHLLGVFPFEGNEYALLNPVDGPLAGANAGPTVLMRFVEKDDKALFQRKRDYDELEVAKVTLAKTREDLVASLEKGGPLCSATIGTGNNRLARVGYWPPGWLGNKRKE